MPHRIFHARHNPPSMTDRLLAHPYVVFGPYSVYIGVVILLQVLEGAHLLGLSVWITAVMACFFMGGGVALTVGIMCPDRCRVASWWLEIAGWSAIAAASISILIIPEGLNDAGTLTLIVLAGARLVVLLSNRTTIVHVVSAEEVQRWNDDG